MKKNLLLIVFLSRTLFSLTITPEALEKSLQSATLIADIETLETTAVADSAVFAKSLANARVLNVLQKREEESLVSQDQIQIEFVGGELGEKGAFFSGLPRLYRGRRYRAHLKRNENQTWSIVGFEFGLTPLDKARSFSRNRTDGSNGDGKGAFLFWDNSFMPIPYFISEPTFRNHPDYIAQIENSFKTWRDLDNTRIEIYPMGCSNTQYNENDGINNIILISDKWSFDTTAIAITRNFYVAGSSERAGTILDSDILLNGVNHAFTTKNETGKHDVQNIITHEVGHFLGMGHETNPQDPDATMYAVASTGETKKRTLATSDIAGVRAAYQGVGEKLKNAGTTCAMTENNTGCRLGVKNQRTTFPYGFILGLVFLVSQIFLGRWAYCYSKCSERRCARNG